MEEMVQSMQQYKSKIDQLKQEKSSLSVTYEVMDVSCSHNLVWVHLYSIQFQTSQFFWSIRFYLFSKHHTITYPEVFS